LSTAQQNAFHYTLELQLSGLNGTARNPDMQKIRIIVFFFEKGQHWQFEVGRKKFYKRLF
jgi:hypothetical protein